MPRSNPAARQRLVAAAVDMLRRRGLNATSVREVAKHAQAPLGSTYHYFPGGKGQMVAEAVHFAGDAVATILRKELNAGPLEGLRAFFGLWRESVIAADFRAGCPVLSVSAEEPLGDEGSDALTAAAEVFGSWESLLTDLFAEKVRNRREAETLATLIIASIEGAIAMCRAKRSIEPLERVGEQLEAVLRAAINEEGTPPPRLCRLGQYSQ